MEVKICKKSSPSIKRQIMKEGLGSHQPATCRSCKHWNCQCKEPAPLSKRDPENYCFRRMGIYSAPRTCFCIKPRGLLRSKHRSLNIFCPRDFVYSGHGQRVFVYPISMSKSDLPRPNFQPPPLPRIEQSSQNNQSIINRKLIQACYAIMLPVPQTVRK